MEANLEEGQKIAKAAGAKEVWVGRAAIPTTHLHGGTIMGTDAANSVVNSYGQCHELPNLYIAGPSIFSDRRCVESDLHDPSPSRYAGPSNWRRNGPRSRDEE